MLAATLALIPVLILEVEATGDWVTVARVANWLIWCVFAAEFAYVLVVAPRRRAALRAHWLDLAVVIVTTPLFGQFLSSLRLLRLARLLRLLRVGLIVSRAIRAERSLARGTTFRLAALLTLFFVVVTGAAQATFDAEEFPSIWDGVWWATVTVTTVGYGDLYPKDVTGRIIGILVMLVGIGFIAVLTATVAAHFLDTDTEQQDREVIDTLRRIEAELAQLRDAIGQRPASG